MTSTNAFAILDDANLDAIFPVFTEERSFSSASPSSSYSGTLVSRSDIGLGVAFPFPHPTNNGIVNVTINVQASVCTLVLFACDAIAR